MTALVDRSAGAACLAVVDSSDRDHMTAVAEVIDTMVVIVADLAVLDGETALEELQVVHERQFKVEASKATRI